MTDQMTRPGPGHAVDSTGSIGEQQRRESATHRPHPQRAPQQRRSIHGMPVSEKVDLIGAGVAGLALSSLLFGWFTPMQGGIGFVVVAFLSFIALYVTLVKTTSTWLEVADRVTSVLFVSLGSLLFSALGFIVVYTLSRGVEPLSHLNFFIEDMRIAGPLDPLDMGGIVHAIVGTAVFLNEVGGRFARFVRTVADAMTALPSVVAGLFIYAALILGVTRERSGFAAALAITVMMLPIIIRSADVVLRLVPNNLREAAYALGANRWRTVWHVVLPTARSGLVTAVILGTARGIGETSPVLLTSGITGAMNTNPFHGPMISLPLQVFDFVRSPEPTMIARGFGTAAVLLILVLVLFMAARFLGGRPPGDLSERQRRAARAASLRDVKRYADRGRTGVRPDVTPPAAHTVRKES